MAMPAKIAIEVAPRAGLNEVRSEPAQWSGVQLQDAARLVLDVAGRALEEGLSLDDPDPASVQFVGSRAVWTGGRCSGRGTAESWAGAGAFRRRFLEPLVRGAYAGRRGELPLRAYFDLGVLGQTSCRRWLDGLLGAKGARAEIARLKAAVERAEPMGRWSPALAGGGAGESDGEEGLKRILLREIVRVRRCGLIYVIGERSCELGATLVSEAAACVCYDSDERRVAAAHLQQRAIAGERLLPLTGGWERASREADLAIAMPPMKVGGARELAASLRGAARAAVVEHGGESSGRLSDLIAGFGPYFRLSRVVELTGGGRRLCLFEA